MQPFRITPKLPVQAMKTYQIHAPASTHFRAATCAEVECGAYTSGWRTTVDESTELGQGQAYYIRKQSGRLFTEHRNEANLTVFTFEAGQRCFQADAHRTRVERPEIYVVRNGDWRGYGEARRYSRAEDWVDDFANNQDQLARRLESG
ncbi:MAG TPA: hypothetical protein VFC00_02600 [Micromonosporaceae bacterium]|nr:hypothetical protein [Micromonosporaceae bacterium]